MSKYYVAVTPPDVPLAGFLSHSPLALVLRALQRHYIYIQ